MIAANDSTVAHHLSSINIMRAQSANKIIRAINRVGSRIEPLQKEFPSGDEVDGGLHLANTLAPEGAPQWQSWPPIARPLVGEIPPADMFPSSLKDLELLDDAKILRLIAFYNDGFAIRREDSLEIRKEKFKLWCTLQ